MLDGESFFAQSTPCPLTPATQANFTGITPPLGKYVYYLYVTLYAFIGVDVTCMSLIELVRCFFQ